MSSRSSAYLVTIKVGDKLYAGHTQNAIVITPSFEPILSHALQGRYDLEMTQVDVSMTVNGLIYEKSQAEASTHDDFAALRAACNGATAVSFIYGELSAGKQVLTGTARISDYQEIAGSSKGYGTWSVKLRSVRGTVRGEEMPSDIQIVEYGQLYNGYAYTDPREIISSGWHMPTEAEINTLITYLGSGDTASDKMRETGTEYWSLEGGATNESKLNLRASGERNTDGTFDNFKTVFVFMSITPGIPNALKGFVVATNAITNSNFYKKEGHSLRPIKDTTSLSNGQSGTYVGNDRKTYRTICIGAQEWVADNLCETKFRNGDDIPEITDNAAWAALTTAGMCAYNNDWDNV